MQYHATIVTTQKPNLKETEMKPIKTPDFTGITKLVKEIQTQICIDDADVEILDEILQDGLNEYCTLLNGYYEEEYYIAISSARSKAYDDGHSDGYADGYDVGYLDGQSAVQ